MVETPAETEMTRRLTDRHCHLIPGMDDGPSSLEEALGMAAVLASFGFAQVVCTPHMPRGISESYHGNIGSAIIKLKESLLDEGVDLDIHPACEYYLDEFLLNSLADPLPLSVNTVLIEAHRSVQREVLTKTIYQIIAVKKLQPLLAHPERYDLFDYVLSGFKSKNIFSCLWPRNKVSYDPNMSCADRVRSDVNRDVLATLRDMGCQFQGNIGSFVGIYGERVRKRALFFLRNDLYDFLGTDAHKLSGLSDWLEEGLRVIRREIGLDGLARLLRPLDASTCSGAGTKLAYGK